MMEIWQTVMPSPLGPVELATDGTAITSILFADDATPLMPAEHPLLKQAVTELQAYFAGSLSLFTFAMAQPGTPFQQRVWQQLQTLPFGSTMSYKKMAILLGDEKCIRAAGTANGKNQLAIAVPCHRVIGSNGELIGYAGGLWRKKWLLEHEASLSGKAMQGELFS